MFAQNCENTTAKNKETRTKVDFLFEKANILIKRPARKLARKLRQTNLDPHQ